MIDEVNTARDVALLSINATLDGRLAVPAGDRRDRRRQARVRASCSPTTRGSVGATDIPDAWHSRFPATLEVTSNWAALAELGAPGPLVAEAMRLDRQRTRRRGRAHMDAAVPRHRIAVADERAGRRARGARVLRLEPPRAGQRRQDPGRRGGCRRAGCSTRPATAACGSRRAAAPPERSDGYPRAVTSCPRPATSRRDGAVSRAAAAPGGRRSEASGPGLPGPL